ncbi:MAG: hypothetical protein Q8L14_22235 [Myxococcales bacterium]|nr:hypothetical protein [Myxococcales bacterium]
MKALDWSAAAATSTLLTGSSSMREPPPRVTSVAMQPSSLARRMPAPMEAESLKSTS